MTNNNNNNNTENTMQIINDLEWVADLDNVDHEICDVATAAIEAIQSQQRMIERLAETVRQQQTELEGLAFRQER